MDFFTNQWAPSRRAFRSPKLRRSPTVVQIPVKFPGEDETRPAPAPALKIQKVFRGYLVRKSVREILGIKREVDAIEARVSEKAARDLIRQKSGNERLKVNEALMALLFKLDAVSCRGDAGIRLCRKAVIRKAIALQEKVDSMANDEKLELSSTDSDQIRPWRMIIKDDPFSPMEEDDKKSFGGGGGDRGLVARLVEQNGEMMKMITELCEKSEAQAKMLAGLTHRVGKLEKVFVCDKIDKMRRKKMTVLLD